MLSRASPFTHFSIAPSSPSFQWYTSPCEPSLLSPFPHLFSLPFSIAPSSQSFQWYTSPCNPSLLSPSPFPVSFPSPSPFFPPPPPQSKSQSAEELAAAAAEQEASAARVVHITETAPSGEVIEFDLTTDNKIKTNGGWMYDIYVTKDDKETRHRIVLGRVYSEAVNLPEDAVISRIIAFLLVSFDFEIVESGAEKGGRVYSEAVNLPEDAVIARIIAFLLHKKIPRQTEGVLSSEQFPINYFAVSEVAQKFEDLGEWFPGGDLPDSYWRFNRIHEYGNVTAPVSTQEAPQLYSPKY
ncbi:unnamed protein product [Closterium sp. NIES-53]